MLCARGFRDFGIGVQGPGINVVEKVDGKEIPVPAAHHLDRFSFTVYAGAT